MTAKRSVAEAPSKRFRKSGLGDLRFRALLSKAEWLALPPLVRARFSKRLAGGNTAIYVGKIVEAKFSRVGRLLAQCARLIGGPFPTSADVDVPSVVTVTEDMVTGGQVWTRLYARRDGLPQVIHSSKRFCGETGLEEHVGHGVGMSLRVSVEKNAIVFRSVRYFVHVFGYRVLLPSWLTPGALTVTHAECGDGAFSFSLEVRHALLGLLIRQVGVFKEVSQ